MAGHSKWSNIKFRKNSQDIKRGKLFTKLINEIISSVSSSGSDITANAKLRMLIDKALIANMNRSTINNAIQRGDGNLISTKNYNVACYEGYGPGGSAIIINCFTDNFKRVVSEVRYFFLKFNGRFGVPGSVMHLFEKTYDVVILNQCNIKYVMNIISEVNVNSCIIKKNGLIKITINSLYFSLLKKICNKNSLKIECSKLVMIPYIKIKLDEKEVIEYHKLIYLLKEIKDVQSIVTNVEISKKH